MLGFDMKALEDGIKHLNTIFAGILQTLADIKHILERIEAKLDKVQGKDE